MTQTMQYKCTLLSDVVLNQKAATEGNQESLDFIPGNNFLGIVARMYDTLLPEDQIRVFHSGDVRFGDAHPASNTCRSLRIPTSMYHPKFVDVSEECYIRHFYNQKKGAEDQQLKQCRTGFYTFLNGQCMRVEVNKSFAIKSAYDNESRRSKDAMMYGYQSIEKGAEFYFEVETANTVSDDLRKKINAALIGTQRVGRSRTAQYGLVEITNADFSNATSTSALQTIADKQCVTVYADGRLIFLDQYGMPTFTPSACDLGIDGGTILWEKSQIRTFQYAPWNFKRQARDTDRCGIEKGSVFVVEIDKKVDLSGIPGYVGSYNNEGFGKIIINPDFLNVIKDSNGKAVYSFINSTQPKTQKTKADSTLKTDDAKLLAHLVSAKNNEEKISKVYKCVNEFVEKNTRFFLAESFASQWGSIRSIAMLYPDKAKLQEELFDKKIMKDGKNIPFAYLTHGVAKDKWEDKGRIELLRKFLKDLDSDMAQFALINLSAEMAKNVRRNKYGKHSIHTSLFSEGSNGSRNTSCCRLRRERYHFRCFSDNRCEWITIHTRYLIVWNIASCHWG